MINVVIDEFTPCLKDTRTGEIVQTIAVTRNDDVQALYISWMCASPDNNKQIAGTAKYLGVGGHLFAIAAKKSVSYGYDGYMYGFAADKELLEHYVNTFHGEVIAILHPYQFAIDEQAAKEIMEVYDYEWTDEEI